MPPTPDALALVHEGWDQLKHERPLAAWACWQRALRVEPDQPAARQALDRLANAPELPASARKEYRFRTPSDPDRRSRWDATFRGRDLSDLSDAASAFAALADAEPDDPDAPYNQALCLAWLGRDAEAIECLDRSVRLGAAGDFEAAVAAWMIAGVLRQGGGAEELADEFRYAIEGDGAPSYLVESLARRVALRQLPAPAESPRDHVTVYEWLDLPWPQEREGALWLDQLPRVVAIVLATGRGARFSSATPGGMAVVIDTLHGLGLGEPLPDRTPLPLALLDSWVWTIRLPEWVDDETRRRLYRENVEDAFENRWIHRPLRSLGGISPLGEASSPLSASWFTDASARAKLEAAIRLFEELAARLMAVELYQGYPFDRLRRRLGLAPTVPEAIDPADATSMSGDDLDRLDPATLDEHALVDAFRSSLGFADDARAAPFAERLVATNSPALTRLDLLSLFGPLVRRAMDAGRPDEALRWIEEALSADAATRGGRDRHAFTTWRAELHARIGEADHAETTYREMVDHSTAAASVALDGAETLLDNGHDDQGRRLAELARDLAHEHGDAATAREAEALLDRIEPGNSP